MNRLRCNYSKKLEKIRKLEKIILSPLKCLWKNAFAGEKSTFISRGNLGGGDYANET